MLRSVREALTNLFKAPATVRYPAEPISVSPGYRGLIKYQQDVCTECERCGRECPANSIVWSRNEDGRAEFHYNPFLCIYCGECVRNCPQAGKGALKQSEELGAPGSAESMPDWDRIVAEADASQKAYEKRKAEQKAREKAEKQKLQAVTEPPAGE